MHILHRLLGLYVAGVAAVVAVSLLATLIWSNGAGSPIWVPLNWLQAAAIIIVLVVNTLRKRSLDANGADGSITCAYLEVNLLFYVSIVVTVWFFWNWLFFGFFLDNEPAGAASDTHTMMWPFINALDIPLLGATGYHLWRRAAA